MRLMTENLIVGYGESSTLKGIDLTIPEGKVTALLGPNGCGKSTLLKALSRILKPKGGEVLWEGKSIHQHSSRYIAHKLSLLPQSQDPPEGICVRDAVAYGRSPYMNFMGMLCDQDYLSVDKAMKATGVHDLSEIPVTKLSGGQQQRVWLAMTLAQDSDYILLDEPTTYLDLNHQVELMSLLRILNKQGKTIVTVLHDVNQACRYCDHLIVMQEGRLVTQGKPSDILTADLLDQVFNLDAEVHKDPIAGTPMCVVR